jgi:hypothetical protein
VHTYAGIGSRETPGDVFDAMVEFARLMAARGWGLRSGGADGADTAFANGALLWAPTRFELYLPWHRYNGHQVARLHGPTEAAYELAAQFHPAWEGLSAQARTLHARNSHVILGPELDDPVSMVVCWTPDGSLDGSSPRAGGTGQALRIAADRGIRVFNLALDEHMERIGRFVGPAWVNPRLFV